MNKLTLVEDVEERLNNFGLPSDIRGSIVGSLEQRKAHKIEKHTITYKNQFFPQLNKVWNEGYYPLFAFGPGLCIISLISLIMNIMGFDVPLPPTFMLLGLSLICCMILGFVTHNKIMVHAAESSALIERFKNKYEQNIQALYTEPVSFLNQAIHYCRKHSKSYKRELVKIDAEFKIAVTDPREHYKKEKDQAEADLQRLKNTTQKELPDVGIFIAAAESCIEFCDQKLEQILPKEMEIASRIEKVKAKANSISVGITDLVRLKTEFESLDDIMQRSKKRINLERYAEVVELRRAQAFAAIEQRLGTIEEDMDYTSNGIRQILQSIPEPEMFGVNQPPLQIVA